MAEARKRVRRVLAKVVLGSSLAAVLACLLIIGLGFALSAGWKRDALREGLATALTDALDAEVSIEVFEGPLFPFWDLRGVKIAMPKQGLGFEMDHLYLRINPRSYFERDEFRVSSLRVDGLRVLVDLESGPEEGEAAPEVVVEGDAGPDPLERVVLEKVNVSNASIHVKAPPGAPRSSVEMAFELQAREAPLASLSEAIEHVNASGRSTLEWRDADGDILLAGDFTLALESGVVRLRRIELAPARAGRARGRASLDLTSWLAQRSAPLEVHLESEDLRVSAVGRIMGETIEELSIEATLDTLGVVETFIPQIAPSAGRVSLVGRIRGDAPDLVGEIRVDATGIVIQERALGVLTARVEALGHGVFQVSEFSLPDSEPSLALHGVTRIQIEGSRVGVQDLALDVAGHRVRVAGWLDPSGFAPLRIQTEELDLAEISEWLALPHALAGVLDAYVRLSGPFDFPEATGELSWRQPRLGDATAERIDLTLETKGAVLALEGSVRSDGRTVLSTRARVPIAPMTTLQWDELVTSPDTALWLQVEGFDLSLLAQLTEDPTKLAGIADLSLDLVGPLTSPKGQGQLVVAGGVLQDVPIGAVRASLEGRDGAYQIKQLALPDLEIPVHLAPGGRIELREEHVTLTGLRLHTGDREILRADVTLPYPQPGPAPLEQIAASPQTRIAIRGVDFDLSLLEAVIPAYASGIRGSAKFDVSIEGDPVEPVFRGGLELSGGSLRLKPLRTPIAPVVAKLVFDNRVVSISELRLGPPGASALMTGTVALDGLSPTDLTLDLVLEDLPIRRTGVLRTELSGTASVRGKVRQPELKGRVRLNETRVVVGQAQEAEMQEIRVIAKGAPRGAGSQELVESARGTSTFLDRAIIDVVLEIPEETRATGVGMDLQLLGELNLEKESLKPARLSGSVETLRGTYRIQNRNFRIRRGGVRFDGGQRINPAVDVEAESRVRDVTLIAFITGNLDDLQVRFESEPPMSEDDVLSYLVLGKPAGESDATGAMTSVALSLASGVALSELESALGSSLPIQSFEIRIEEDGGPVEVKVGRSLGSRIFVRYGHTFGIEQEDAFDVELRLNRNWSVSSEVSTRGSAGADLVWGIEW